jgi:hypothetical protein
MLGVQETVLEISTTLLRLDRTGVKYGRERILSRQSIFLDSLRVRVLYCSK